MSKNKLTPTILPQARRCAVAAAIMASATCACAVQPAPQAAASRRPQLVVGIMVDGLRADYLHMLQGHFGTDGFRRLMDGGVLIENVDYGPAVDRAGALAMIYTGASPATNGVATTNVYNVERGIERPTLLDPGKIGNYTDETLSPAALLTSTLADELRIDGAGAAYVHSIAPDATCAIIMSGHAGNTAFWINDANGKWATTTHYRDGVPTPVSARNFSEPLSIRIDTTRWQPSLPIADYPCLPAHKKHYPFQHSFSTSNRNCYVLYKQAAPVNTDVTSLATEYIKSMRLGDRNAMDMLNVAYTVAPYPGSSDIDGRLEMMDAYIKLDRELARLFSAIDAQVGTDGAVVFLTGTPVPPAADVYDPQWQLPTGEFSARKARSLLNMYLIARHGNGDWISGFHNGAFYLNHALIEEHGIDDEELRSDAAKFLCRMSGVAGAHTLDDILEVKADENPSLLKRNTVVTQAADIYVQILPGWELVDDTDPLTPSRTTVRAHATTAPAIIYAPGTVSAARIDTPVDALRIAPTVARILRIRSPNGAQSPPLSEIFVR